MSKTDNLLDRYVFRFQKTDHQSMLEFINFCNVGNVREVKKLVKEGINIGIYNNLGFELACIKGNYEVVKYLISAGVDINNNDSFGFRKACDSGHKKIVELLLDSETKIPNSGIKQACINGHIDIVDMLLHRGVNWQVIQENKNVISYLAPEKFTNKHSIKLMKIYKEETGITVKPLMEYQNIIENFMISDLANIVIGYC